MVRDSRDSPRVSESVRDCSDRRRGRAVGRRAPPAGALRLRRTRPSRGRWRRLWRRTAAAEVRDTSETLPRQLRDALPHALSRCPSRAAAPSAPPEQHAQSMRAAPTDRSTARAQGLAAASARRVGPCIPAAVRPADRRSTCVCHAPPVPRGPSTNPPCLQATDADAALAWAMQQSLQSAGVGPAPPARAPADAGAPTATARPPPAAAPLPSPLIDLDMD